MRLWPALLAGGLFAASLGPGGLFDAVQRGDAEAVAALIRRGADVNALGPDGSTALLYAVHLNNTAIAEVLLRAGAKAGAANEYGVTPLLEAAAAGNPALIEKLLKAGASAESESPEGETVLMTAARKGNAEAVRLLLSQGAAVDRHENWKGQTALMWAAAGNHADAARILIEHGAALNARSAAVTPEVKRPANGNLVSEQPKGSLTPLLFAAREGALAGVRVLVKAGAELNLAEPDGITPLIMAIINGHYDVAGFLLEAGADPNLADLWGRTALYAAVDMHTLEPSTTRPAPKDVNALSGLDIARLALSKGAAPDPRLKAATPGRGIPDGPDPLLRAGTTPFVRAAKTGDVAAMRLLLEHGADPKAATEQGVTALMAASGQGWRYGDSQIRAEDALEGVKLCVSLGLDVNAANKKGETALHGAADRGADSIVRYLLSRGARADVKDEKGHTPLEVARGGQVRGHPGYPSTAALLMQTVSPPPATLGKPKRVKDVLYVIEAPLNGAEGPNIAIYVTGEGVLLVDDRFDQDFEQAVARVKTITDQPIRYVVKTHNHGANTGEYRKLLPGVESVASVEARRNMERMKMAAPPRIAYVGEASIFLGGKEIRLLQLGRSHTDGDTVVYFPSERAVYVGDLMAATERVTNPSVDYLSGGSLGAWPGTLDKVLALEMDTVIPGTGFGVTDRAALVAHRNKVEAVGKRVRALVSAGNSKEEVRAALVEEFSFKPVNLHGLDGMVEEMRK